MQRRLRLRQNAKSWTLFGATEPRVSGVFYCLRLYRKEPENGAWLTLTTQDKKLEYNPHNGRFSANIPAQDLKKCAGIYLYELTENTNGQVNLLQRGELTIPISAFVAVKAVTAQPVNQGGDPLMADTGDDVDMVAFYRATRNRNIGNTANPSPLD